MSVRIDEITQTRTAKKFIRDSKTGKLVEKSGTTTITRPVKKATNLQRFVGHLIDFLIVYALYYLHLFVADGVGLDMFPYFRWYYYISSGESKLTIGFLMYPYIILYYTAFEYFTQSTPGKLITGMVVINEHAEKPSLFRVFVRTCARLIPFDPFSFAKGTRGWHDTLSSTWVVKKEERDMLKKLIANVESDSPLVEKDLF